MERNSQVLEVELSYDGQPHRASYFVEADKIFANIGGRVLIAPLGPVPATETVRTMLSGYLLQRSRKFRQASGWARP